MEICSSDSSSCLCLQFYIHEFGCITCSKTQPCWVCSVKFTSRSVCAWSRKSAQSPPETSCTLPCSKIKSMKTLMKSFMTWVMTLHHLQDHLSYEKQWLVGSCTLFRILLPGILIFHHRNPNNAACFQKLPIWNLVLSISQMNSKCCRGMWQREKVAPKIHHSRIAIGLLISQPNRIQTTSFWIQPNCFTEIWVLGGFWGVFSMEEILHQLGWC